MVAHHVSLASVHLKRVHDEVIVVQQSAVLDGRRELHVETVDEGTVEVDPKVHAAGKLAQHVMVRVDT